MTTRVLERLRHRDDDDELAVLTPQERKILDLIAEGLTNRQIGEQMFLAEKTVKNYVSNVLSKLGMSRRTEAAAYAARLDERRRAPRGTAEGHRSRDLRLCGGCSPLRTVTPMSESNERTQDRSDPGRPRIVVGVDDAPSAEVALRWAEVEGRNPWGRAARDDGRGHAPGLLPGRLAHLVGRHPGPARGHRQAPRRHRRADRSAPRGRGPAGPRRLGRAGAPRGCP